MRFVKVVAFALLAPTFAAMLWSQTGTSTVRGTVTDPQGRVIPDATLTLTNIANNAPRTVKSSDGGTFCRPANIDWKRKHPASKSGSRTMSAP